MLRFFATHGSWPCQLSSVREPASHRDHSQMRNSEESSTTNPRPALFERIEWASVLPVRAWCDLLDTPALGIRNIGALVCSFFERLIGVFPLGRVGAEIVCENTLVQYAAYLTLLLFLELRFGMRGQMVSFDSDHSGGSGASPFFSFRSVFLLASSHLFGVAVCCAGWG